jgi:cysteine desulfurase
MKQNGIYIDNNATTPLDERVLQAMLPYFTHEFGNASSSTHRYGWVAKDALETARTQVAETVGAEDAEVSFTSGATDAINQAIVGVFQLFKEHKNHFITAVTEHKAVLDAHRFIEKEGAQLTYLSVDNNGLIDLKQLENSITENTAMVSVMLANNETGVLQDVKSIAQIVHQKNSVFFCDAVQALGKIPLNVNDLGIDIMPLSAHKIYGPKGAGALYTRRKSPRIKLPQFLHTGTPNVPAIVGFGKACTLISLKENDKVLRLKVELLEGLQHLGFIQNVGDIPTLPNTINGRFDKIRASELMQKTDGLAYSLGSACNSADAKLSHVLKAMGLTDAQIQSSFRISLGRFNSSEEIKTTVKEFLGHIN